MIPVEIENAKLKLALEIPEVLRRQLQMMQ